MAAGMEIDPGFCIGGGESVLEARLAFGRSTAAVVLGFAAYDRLLEENKGAIEIIRSICSAETDAIQRRHCASDALNDRIVEVERRILDYLDERLPAIAIEETPYETLPDGGSVAVFLAAVLSDSARPVFSSPLLEPEHRLGEIAAGTRTVATGILLADLKPGSVFRILWQHGTVAWTPAAGWNFDPTLLRAGRFNLEPSFDQATDVDDARRQCIAAAQGAIVTSAPVTLLGPWPAGNQQHYMRVAIGDVDAFECVAAPGSGKPASIAATSRTE
ncbi:MAG: hypothetical protein SGJ07_11825 [Rhodospirillaceae bacterium]|nr:hypothetical protein [Rhodospirillaceae bacterium]